MPLSCLSGRSHGTWRKKTWNLCLNSLGKSTNWQCWRTATPACTKVTVAVACSPILSTQLGVCLQKCCSSTKSIRAQVVFFYYVTAVRLFFLFIGAIGLRSEKPVTEIYIECTFCILHNYITSASRTGDIITTMVLFPNVSAFLYSLIIPMQPVPFYFVNSPQIHIFSFIFVTAYS